MDMREYIINNFKNDDKSSIEEAINSSITSKEEEPLIGLGVLFELLWKNSNENEKDIVLNNIMKGFK